MGFFSATGQEGPVKIGNYATSINVHNPMPFSFGPQGNQNPGIQVLKKAVVTFAAPNSVDNLSSHEQARIPEKEPLTVSLPPDGALQIDCTDIRQMLVPVTVTAAFIEGDVVIESGPQLAVQGVYTGYTVDADARGDGQSATVQSAQAESAKITPPQGFAEEVVAVTATQEPCPLPPPSGFPAFLCPQQGGTSNTNTFSHT